MRNGHIEKSSLRQGVSESLRHHCCLLKACGAIMKGYGDCNGIVETGAI